MHFFFMISIASHLIFGTTVLNDEELRPKYSYEKEVKIAVKSSDISLCPIDKERPWIVEVCKERVIYSSSSIKVCEKEFSDFPFNHARCVGIFGKSKKLNGLCRKNSEAPRNKKYKKYLSICMNYFNSYYGGAIEDLLYSHLMIKKKIPSKMHPKFYLKKRNPHIKEIKSNPLFY